MTKNTHKQTQTRGATLNIELTTTETFRFVKIQSNYTLSLSDNNQAGDIAAFNSTFRYPGALTQYN